MTTLTVHDATPAMADGMTTDPVIQRLAESLGIQAVAPLAATYHAGTFYRLYEVPFAAVAAEVARINLEPGKTQLFQDAMAVGLTRFVVIEDGATIGRGDVPNRQFTVAINEDGTRGAIMTNDVTARLVDDEEAESFVRGSMNAAL